MSSLHVTATFSFPVTEEIDKGRTVDSLLDRLKPIAEQIAEQLAEEGVRAVILSTDAAYDEGDGEDRLILESRQVFRAENEEETDYDD